MTKNVGDMWLRTHNSNCIAFWNAANAPLIQMQNVKFSWKKSDKSVA